MQSCSTGAACCGGACDPTSKTCGLTSTACLGSGTACSAPTECCSATCSNGKCGADLCVVNSGACTAGDECCSNTCTGGVCAAISTSGCTTLGNTCAKGSDCCSGNCQAGRCSASGAACASLGDICFKLGDCCSGICTIAAGASAGTCTAVQTTGAGQCSIDGQACTGGTGCCSRLCVPTNTGGHVCQVAQGCRVVGDICSKDTDCCGGPVGGPGSGNVTCVVEAGTTPPVGRCRNPLSCNPEGDVCGGTGTGKVNARQDCCDCAPPKFNCCKPDSNKKGASMLRNADRYQRMQDGIHWNCAVLYSGRTAVLRSRPSAAPACRAFPDSQGTLRCLTPPPTGPACVASGGVCTSPSDCCPGLTCNISGGAAQGTCGVSAPPPPQPGQPPPAPNCATSGQICTKNADCCYGGCFAPTGAACMAGQTGCACQAVIQ